MKKYSEIVEEFMAKPFSEEDEIFDYQDSPYAQEFDDTFNFYQQTLKDNEHYGIVPNRLYFNTEYSVNARAGKSEDYYLISINMGTIVAMLKTFKENPKLAIVAGGSFEVLKKYLDAPIQEIMYQMAVHYTFYHEMAHLIQKSDLLFSGLYEHSGNSDDFTMEKHLLELDADEYSSVSMAAHITQYSQKVFFDGISAVKVEELFIVVCGAILLYVLSFPTNKKELYFKEMTHPHPVIRITRIITILVGHATDTFRQLGIALKIDIMRVLIKTIEFAGKVGNDSDGNNPTERYIDYLINRSNEITAYIKEFDELGVDDERLAANKWNAYARTLR
jgi:hypothetical protein